MAGHLDHQRHIRNFNGIATGIYTAVLANGILQMNCSFCHSPSTVRDQRTISHLIQAKELIMIKDTYYNTLVFSQEVLVTKLKNHSR